MFLSRYVLWEAEDKGLELPYACRMGCCTACAVKVVEGEVYQPQVGCVWVRAVHEGCTGVCACCTDVEDIFCPRHPCSIVHVSNNTHAHINTATSTNTTAHRPRHWASVRSSSSRGMRSCVWGIHAPTVCCRLWRRMRCMTCRYGWCPLLVYGVIPVRWSLPVLLRTVPSFAWATLLNPYTVWALF